MEVVKYTPGPRRALANLIGIFPATRCFSWKRRFLRFSGIEMHGNPRVCSSARFRTIGPIEIGDKTWIGHEVLFSGGNASIRIGKNCDIAPRVHFATGTHEKLIGQEKAAGKGVSIPIEIGDGCWICANVTVLGGSKVGECCIVAAGAVVRGEYPDRTLIGGAPARVLRYIR